MGRRGTDPYPVALLAVDIVADEFGAADELGDLVDDGEGVAYLDDGAEFGAEEDSIEANLLFLLDAVSATFHEASPRSATMHVVVERVGLEGGFAPLAAGGCGGFGGAGADEVDLDVERDERFIALVGAHGKIDDDSAARERWKRRSFVAAEAAEGAQTFAGTIDGICR